MATSVLTAASASAIAIEGFLEAPSGGVLSGTLLITRSGPTQGLRRGERRSGHDHLGISSISTVRARDHWITALISRDACTYADGDGMGFSFGIFPIGSTKPSAFDIDTTAVRLLMGLSLIASRRS